MLGSQLIARGALELLWESCYESGDDYVGTSEDIETLVGWDGEKGLLTRALVDAGAPEGAGFIEVVAESAERVAYRVHDLWHHAPDYVAKRRLRELARQQKGTPEPVRRTAPNGAGSSEFSHGQIETGRTPSPSHSPSHSHHERTDSAAMQGSVENRVSHSQEPAEVREIKTFLVFPVVGIGAAAWVLSEAQVAEWARLFPGLDIRREARKALAWVQANPNRRKTERGMAKFLVGWLTRATDRGASRVQSTERADVTRTNYALNCPHSPECSSRHACHVKQQIAAAKAQA